MPIDTIDQLHYWNNRLYSEFNDDKYKTPKSCNAEWFYEFGIESAPKFRDKCWSHIPVCWAEDVKLMIESIQEQCPSVTFRQIKEKFCQLTVYMSGSDLDLATAYHEVTKCKQRLINKDIHPI
jgi:hypothetical protein